MTAGGLAATIALRRGRLAIDVSLAVAPGELLAIVGPNGAGKSTVLQVIAGLVPLASGSVRLADEVLEDGVTGRRVPSERRSIGLVPQDGLLFPHLSALDNVAFGLRSRGASASDARRLARDWLERVGLADHAGHRPAALSGGQVQRVALARAMAPGPRLLLMDEPLGAVDLGARAELSRLIRAEIGASAACRLLVTHDPLEALSLAERILVVEDGRCIQQGLASDVVARPRSPWVARMLGVNLLRGDARADGFHLPRGGLIHVTGDVRGSALAVIHPRGVALHRTPPGGSPRNIWSGSVEGLDIGGDRIRVRVRVLDNVGMVAEVTPSAAAELHLADGGPVFVAVKATEFDVYPG